MGATDGGVGATDGGVGATDGGVGAAEVGVGAAEVGAGVRVNAGRWTWDECRSIVGSIKSMSYGAMVSVVECPHYNHKCIRIYRSARGYVYSNIEFSVEKYAFLSLI